jgi:hypothetical protein
MAEHDLLLVPDLPPEEEIQEGVEGLAWEHATLFSSLSDIELGSEEFVDLHKDLLERYRESGNHLGFIQNAAMRLVQALLESNRIALVIGKDDNSENVSDNITYLGHVVTSCLMWMHAAYPAQWLNNTQWEHLDDNYRGVEFRITTPNGGERNDDDR